MSTLITSPTLIRMLIVDDSPDVAEAMERCIMRQADMGIVGYRESADRLLGDVSDTHADIVLLDLMMPGKDPLAALRELTAAHLPRCNEGPGLAPRVIVYSAHTDPDNVANAARAGACGYLSKGAEVRVMLEAIRAVARGVAFRLWE